MSVAGRYLCTLLNRLSVVISMEIVLDILSEYFGDVWCIRPCSSLYLIELRSDVPSRELYPVQCAVWSRWFCCFCRFFHYSVRKFLEFAEPRDLRQLDKGIPAAVTGSDLCERAIKFLSLDVNWRRGKSLSAIKELTEALEVFTKILSDEAVTRGIPYCFAGWIVNFAQLPQVLRNYDIRGCFSTAFLLGSDGVPTLVSGVLGRVSRGVLVKVLSVLIRCVLRCCDEGLRWVLFGSHKVQRSDVEKLLRKRI